MARIIYYTKQADSPVQWKGKKYPVGPGGVIETDDEAFVKFIMEAKLAFPENLGSVETGKGIQDDRGVKTTPIIPLTIDNMKRPDLLLEIGKRDGLKIPPGNMSNDLVRQMIKDWDTSKALEEEMLKERMLLNEQAIALGVTIQPEMNNEAIKAAILAAQQEKDRIELLGTSGTPG